MQNQHSMVIYSFLFIVMLLAACSTMPDGTSKAPAEEIITSTYFPQSTQTSTPDPMPTVLPTLELDYDCSTSSKAPNVDLYYEDGKLSRMGNGRAYGIDWSADGSMIAIGGETGIYLIDAITMQKIRYIQTYYGTEVVRFSPHGKWIAADDANVVSIWDIDSGEKLFSVGEDVDIHSVRGHYPTNVEMGNFTFSPDSKKIILFTMDNFSKQPKTTIEVWNIESQTKILEINNDGDDEEKWIFPNPSISPFGQRLASTWNKNIRIWDINTGELLRQYDDYRSYVEFSPDGKNILAHRDNQFHLIDLQTNETTILTMKEDRYNHAATFSYDGSKIIVEYADHDETPITIWSTNGEYLHDIPLNDYILTMAVNPKKDELATFGYNQTLSIWDINTGALLREYRLSAYMGYELTVSPDGSRILIENDDGLHFIDSETGAYRCSVQMNSDRQHSVSFHPTLPYVAIIDPAENRADIYDITSTEHLQRIEFNHSGYQYEIKKLLGYEIFHNSLSNTDIIFWKWLNENGNPIAWIINNCDGFSAGPTRCSGAISSDGKRFVTWVDQELYLFDTNTKQPIGTLPGAASDNYTFTPDGKYLLNLRFLDWSIEIIDIKTRQLVKTISFGMEAEGPILGLQKFNFTSDGKYMLMYRIFRNEQSVKIWNTETWEELHGYDTISSVGNTAMSADGSLVSALSGYTLYLWHNELPLSGENP